MHNTRNYKGFNIVMKNLGLETNWGNFRYYRARKRGHNKICELLRNKKKYVHTEITKIRYKIPDTTQILHRTHKHSWHCVKITCTKFTIYEWFCFFFVTRNERTTNSCAGWKATGASARITPVIVKNNSKYKFIVAVRCRQLYILVKQ